jgi:hypothetical protein
MVRIHPDPPPAGHGRRLIGGVAQLGEHLLCKQGVIGSIPFTSTTLLAARAAFGLSPPRTVAIASRLPSSWMSGGFRFDRMRSDVRLLFNNSIVSRHVAPLPERQCDCVDQISTVSYV